MQVTNGFGGAGSLTTLSTSGLYTPTGGIKGISTNTNAAAGSVGEYISSTVLSGSATSLVSATAKTVTSISLTAGDWDVSGFVGLLFAATTNTTFLAVSFSTVNNTNGGEGNIAILQYGAGGIVPGSQTQHPIQTIRVSLSGTTTYYLVANCGFTISTCGGFGTIAARRVQPGA